jgi:hypothetical protein
MGGVYSAVGEERDVYHFNLIKLYKPTLHFMTSYMFQLVALLLFHNYFRIHDYLK